MKWRRPLRKDPEIAPDEIFLDAGASGFDRQQFEGRLEQPLSRGVFFSLSGVLILLFIILIVRAGNLQILQGEAFARMSAQNRLESHILFAPRGVITDANGIVLAENAQLPDGSIRRVYPYPELGSVIGYVSYPKKDAKGVYYETEEKGVIGLEAAHDGLLSGENGQVLTETDALGAVRSEGILIPAKSGETLVLAIDADLERRFAAAIRGVVESKGFIAGSGVILDVRSGAVRAIVSYPSYDPNIMSDGSPAATIRSYGSDPGHPFLNHAVQGLFTPGSTVKPFIAAGALTDRLITPSTVINDAGSISLPDPYHAGKRFIYNGWKALGPVDVKKAIAWSSDIFFYTVGGGFGSQKGLGIERLKYWYEQFGLGIPTGVDLPGEAEGLIPDPAWKQTALDEPWYLGDTYFTSIGQYSMQVTPIQLARATAAIANGGRLYTPSLVEGHAPAFTTVPVSPEALAIVREGMRMTVTEALAGALNVPYVKVAAKTGTAETGTRNQYDNSWVEGFFPYENPQYAFVVVLERGPAGSGSQAVNAMRLFLDSLYNANSPYVGGTATSTR
ncbi:hypothetical protein HYV30_01755 [Candidatus Kaiserbacteria bacterium]|nr:hypothetical protein [Candidatus Kaiserbacteria bacterium]